MSFSSASLPAWATLFLTEQFPTLWTMSTRPRPRHGQKVYVMYLCKQSSGPRTMLFPCPLIRLLSANSRRARYMSVALPRQFCSVSNITRRCSRVSWSLRSVSYRAQRRLLILLVVDKLRPTSTKGNNTRLEIKWIISWVSSPSNYHANKWMSWISINA